MNYRALLLLLSLCFAAGAPAMATNTETIGSMTLSFPAEWQRQARPDGTVSYVAGADRGEVQLFNVAVPNSTTPAILHNALWGEVLRTVNAPSGLQSGINGRFHWTEAQGVDANSRQRFWYRLYTTPEAARCFGIVVVSPSAEGYRAQITALESALAKAQLGDAAPTPVDDTRIVESLIYHEMSSFTLTSSRLTEHILFFDNGVVVRSSVINGPIACYAALPATNLQALPAGYGSWRENPSTRGIDITWKEGAAWQLRREGGRFMLDGRVLPQLRPIDGAKLNGLYAYRPVGDEPSILKFNAAGRFEAANLNENMICKTGGPLMPNGSGNYELRKWTLILRFENGVTHMIPIKIAEDQDTVRSFIVKSYEFELMP